MRRRLLVTGVVAVLLAGAMAALLLTRGSGRTGPPASPDLPPATATVTRTTLVETKMVSGTLGYGDPIPISAAERGTLTWIAPVGSTVKRGKPLFKVDERPVIDLYGSLPLYRTLEDARKGRDVRQLERNLAALGYTGFTIDDTYSAATAEAVRAWQGKRGQPETGTVEPDQVVFTRRAVRIAGHTARVGDTVGGESGRGGGSVLSYTGTTRRVTVELEVADQALAVKGRTATVAVPGRGTVKGKISQVSTIVTAGGGAPDEGATPSPAAADARIEVTVAITDQKALGSLDAAPVDVDFVSTKRENVLAVPVVALLAVPRGGFGVQVVDGDTTRIVPVKTGMFASGQVEVSGNGIAEGVKVGVPR